MTHEPKEDDPYICPSFNWDGSLRTGKPEAVYGDKYSLAMHMKPLLCVSSISISVYNYYRNSYRSILMNTKALL